MTPLLLILLAALVLFWLDSMKARDLAAAGARDTCHQQGLQLLDATVTLSRLGLTRTPRGHATLARTYRFEYSRDGATRQTGFIRLRGHRIETIGLADDAG
ncbi:hypothetical protein TspCOW1_17990 [Thiohalobacter sp. COW1]|uniref:DUF3301 domain-containing protein n=1 Tax=Thiohalobacter sp. COW1 TaxID=2795687 RepID=UPI00191513A9|nr:DUF3301 domain-containing protein [Thiohalobacter sp. COW1]BCO31696.1 hypothetical protein TspCOW1_17990 [Thiohalobacter sp. COW1]